MENAKKFFEEIIKTEEAKKLFASYEKPENKDEAIRFYAEIAAKLGTELSEEEIKAYFAEKAPSGEVDDNELSQLSGGNEVRICDHTFIQEENCWFTDACDLVFIEYEDYRCRGDF